MLNVFVCLFMVSSTITVVSPQSSKRSCTLPKYPTYGTYKVTSDPRAKPGQTVDSFIMMVSCRRGYGIEETGKLEQEVFCIGGRWSPEMPKCVRFCRFIAHHSMRYECRLPGQGLGTCEGFVPPRTTVIATCKPQFYSANEVEYMNCMEFGIWDRTVSCEAECGVVTPQAELQLYGGRFAKFGEFPWHVGVYDKTAQPYEQICGGSIITSNLVISAAHCFWDDVIKLLPESLFIVATAKLYRKWNDEKDVLAQKSEIKKIKIPSLFDGVGASFQQDIAMLILKSPFTYLPYVRPVCHDFNSFFEREQLQHGNLGKISGWGLTTVNGGPSPILKVASLPFVSEEVCIKSVPKSFRAYITGDKFCAGYTDGTSAVCKGDSGGGLVFPSLERHKERYYLRGIVSASPRNDDKLCNDVTYAAFTKITAHMKFIIDSIAESTPLACNSYLFQCNDGTCVYPEAECNGIADCKDGSDESYENCTPGAKTTTTTQAPQVCILPPDPEHGSYAVVNKPNAKPGFQADSFVVSVSCDSGYGVKTDGIDNGTATAEVYCFDGEWITELPECIRISITIDNDPNRAPPCDTTSCVLPDCFCSKDGTAIPGNLPARDVPQMITITFDDAINSNNIELYKAIFNGKRKNPNGCDIKATFFVSHKYTNYSAVQETHRKGHEIAVHSISHNNDERWSNASVDDWTKEMAGMRTIIEKFSNITDKSVVGIRAPYLRVGGNNQFTMMEEQAFLYDSTIIAPLSNPPIWPYALYFRMSHRCHSEQNCPTSSQAVWEMVMNELDPRELGNDDFLPGCVMIDSCPNILTADQFYNFLSHNFDRHYEHNRAPLGLYFHASAFMKNSQMFEALLYWIDEILKEHNDVYFVTMTQVIQWINNPRTISEAKNFEPWREKCVVEGIPACWVPRTCKLTSKELPGETINLQTCMRCPVNYPWLNDPTGSGRY